MIIDDGCIALADGSFTAMGDGVAVVRQADELGVPNCVVLTREELVTMLVELDAPEIRRRAVGWWRWLLQWPQRLPTAPQRDDGTIVLA